MNKNKSIDGLVPRHSKKVASKPTKTTVIKTAPVAKKSVATKPRVTKKPVVKPISKSTRKTAPKTRAKINQKPTTPVKVDAVEDFLAPVQTFDFDEQSGKLKASKNPINKINTKKEKKMSTKKKKIITWIIVSILSIILITAIIFVLWGNDIIAKITGGQGNVFDLIFHDETYEPLKTDKNGRTNILAFGTSGYNMEGEEKGGIHDGAQLTDSIMIISLDQETGDLAMVSLPRDLKASPTCTATGKINEVYWCNNMDGDNEEAGAKALVDEVSEILGIDFQYYAHVNWGSLIQIVDTLGGITVTVDEDINDYYRYEAGGTYTMGGEEALWLARIRHGTANGDFTRSASQQKILIGIKDKILEKNLSITDLISLASTLGDNLRTNFSIDELKTLAHLTSEYDFDSMRQISLIEPEPIVTTGTINGISYVLPVGGAGYYKNLQNYIAKMLSSDPRIYEDPSILILNGTEEIGLATEEKNKLEEKGYQNLDIDNAPTNDYTEHITLYSLSDKSGTKKLLEEYYNTKAKSVDQLPAGISQDYDFVIIIGGTSE